MSNVFVDPATMPACLQTIVRLNPVTHLLDAARGLMHGGVAIGDAAWVLLAAAVIVAVFAPLSLRMYHKER
ncbi:ABC transporter permease [Natrinema gelatinilyticum]|uniref:ABC transporter permease n=1 Tax=Natrinema gelatinilyticum TaxID=2961571 RepID=UPI0020C25026|nr:ABC transporter permease [Natrinema gelatinilyticum]